MWKCVNRRMAKKFGDHFIFVNTKGQVAFADHSIRDLNDPSSTDDGLLIWDGGQGAIMVDVDGDPETRFFDFPIDLISRDGRKRKTRVLLSLPNAFILAKLFDKDITEILPGIFDGVNFNALNKACC